MTTDAQRCFTKLKALLGERAADTLYTCVADLVQNGLVRERIPAGVYPPSRQDITQYLAAWCREAGLTAEQTHDWLTEYATSVLILISRRSPAAIRHSTKANVKYIYADQVAFLCGGLENVFCASCRRDCPVYEEMEVKRRAVAKGTWHPCPPYRPPPAIPHRVPVKVKYRAQFEAAIQFIREELAKGTKRRELVPLLEARGFKNRTGRPWTAASLHREIARAPDLRRRRQLFQRPEAAPANPAPGAAAEPAPPSSDAAAKATD